MTFLKILGLTTGMMAWILALIFLIYRALIVQDGVDPLWSAIGIVFVIFTVSLFHWAGTKD